MKRLIILAAVSGLCLLSENVFALSWVFYGDCSGDISSGFTVGATNEGASVTDTQAIQISGAGALLPSGYSSWYVNFHADTATWDSYSQDQGENTGTGYFDVFAAVLSEGGYYWQLIPDPLNSPGNHPLENNPALILASYPSAQASYWGGAYYNDGILETDGWDANLIFNTDPAEEYYLTLFLQTIDDVYYPSWGTFTNIDVSPVPEPTTMSLLGLSLLGLVGLRKRKKKLCQ